MMARSSTKTKKIKMRIRVGDTVEVIVNDGVLVRVKEKPAEEDRAHG